MLASMLVRARQRLKERMERIGPVLWDIKNIEYLRQCRAATEIQRVYRGHQGRFRAEVVRMQLKLSMLPKVRKGRHSCCCVEVRVLLLLDPEHRVVLCRTLPRARFKRSGSS